MKYFSLLCLAFFCLTATAQDSPAIPSPKWQGHLSIGQYPASLLVPSFSALHLGVNAGVSYQWNDNEKHQWIQTGNLAFFHHKNLQKAVQLYTEIGYQLQLKNGLKITPFSIGGGYVLSISDMTTLDWDAATQQYILRKSFARNNWLVSLGASVGYTTKWEIANRPVTLFADYRVQVQGIIIQDAVPVLAYAPVRLGLAIPLH